MSHPIARTAKTDTTAAQMCTPSNSEDLAQVRSMVATANGPLRLATSRPRREGGANGRRTRVPEIAKGPPVPGEGYVMDEIADGVFWLSDGA